MVKRLLILSSMMISALAANGVAQPVAPSKDGWGDPLPSGAVARLGTVRWRATDSVNQLVISPDGKRLLSGDQYSVQLWDVKSGKELGNTLVPFEGRHTFTPDGKRIIAFGRIIGGGVSNRLDILDGHTLQAIGHYEFGGKI